MHSGEFTLDSVEPRSVGGHVDSLHIVARKEIFGRTHVGGQIVHNDIEPQLDGVAGPELGETGHDVLRGFAFAHSPNQAVGMDIIEPMQLLRALVTRIGRSVALWLSPTCPAHAGQRPKLQRAKLVVANDDPVFGATGIQFKNPLFLALNSGSSECFQVLVCCQETSARWSKRRSHSGLTEGNNLCLSK